MEIEFTTTELITDEDILNAFGESIHINEGEFRVDPFIDCLKDRAEEARFCDNGFYGKESSMCLEK